MNDTRVSRGVSIWPFVLVLFAGCASQHPTQYAQGIPMAPSAPAFSPTLDAPIVVGQPGYIGTTENLPRSPHVRELPPTKEPTLFATEQPRAADDAMAPYFAAVRIALPDDSLLGDPTHTTPARFCAVAVMSRLNAMSKTVSASPIQSHKSRMCLAAMLLETCAKAIDSTPSTVRDVMEPLLPATQKAMAERAKRECVGDVGDAIKMHGILAAEWHPVEGR
jgi:hypothetical protein